MSLLFKTWLAKMRQTDGGQSRLGSLYEALANIVIGFSINYFANLVILPHYGCDIGLLDNFWMGWVYTVVSLVRQFILRRWFNARVAAAAKRLAGIPA